MALAITKGYAFAASEQVTATKLSKLIESASITGIPTASLEDGAVTDDKITSVSGAKLTGLTGVPAGSGRIPAANIGTVYSVTAYGTPSVDIGDSLTLAQAALPADGGTIYIPEGTYPQLTTFTMTKQIKLIGSGVESTLIRLDADVESIIQKAGYSCFEGFKITTYGGIGTSHSKAGVEIGTVGMDSDDACSRSVYRDIWVYGAGTNGITVYQTVISHFDNVRCTNNKQDGIQFAANAGGTNNAHVFGLLDCTDNGRYGVNLVNTGAGACFGGTVHVGSNTSYGIYIDTDNNCLTVYGEGNGTRDIYLGANSAGNNIVILSGSITDAGAYNQIRRVDTYPYDYGARYFAYLGATNDAAVDVAVLRAETTESSKSDGFGPQVKFVTDAVGQSAYDMASIVGCRDGADNYGALDFYTNHAGGLVKRMMIDTNGILKLYRGMHFCAGVGTMTGHEEFNQYTGNVFVKDPGGAGRNFNPDGTFTAGFMCIVVNTADDAETITFDSSVLNQAITQNQRGIFVYDGSAWRKVYVG